MTHNIQFPELGFNFTVNTTAFSIGDFSVQWYGVIIAVGFLLAIGYGFKSCKKMNINKDKLFDAILVGLVCGIIGARLYYVLFYPGDKYMNDPMLIFNIKEGGLGIYGGIIGGMLGGAVMAKIRKLNIASVLDVAALGFLIGQCVGRWGNFINQEAFGTATTLPWGMQSDMTALEVVGSVHPCFLYESILCFLGFILLHLFTRYLRRYDGQTFLLYLIWYGASRFLIEGLRTDSLMVPYIDIRVSQLVAALTVLTAVVFLIIFHRRTSLVGCGSKKIMELNGVVFGSAEPVKEEKTAESTIFTQDEVDEKNNDDRILDESDEEKGTSSPDTAAEAADEKESESHQE